ncbi:hypothetical protein DAETH_48540 (plasmid) [Deinococcus aetherius]|uniref:Uncharacterized protein n=1 Tax=Deinococcus aetherius TaxID=200252 RepID=A0ABN6RNL4_9DEIO|nr:hypothetical protein [Deinococcus aetherius]BDP44885.1 hypothetical protein DAETH_48540 [Deinococcus aetherius]
MSQSAPTRNLFPAVAATVCACCGLALPTGQGHDVPHIGAVGPRCVLKFGAFAELLAWVEGRSSALPETREAQFVGHRLVVGLRLLGFEVTSEEGVLRVGRRTRRPVEVAKSWKKRRAEFERDLKLADGLFAAGRAA